MRLFSYVVDHDEGRAPNPYHGICTLCRCKFRKQPKKPRNIVELAVEGDWVIGTGGADRRKSAGNGRLVYAMRVDKKIPRAEYYADRTYACKKPKTGDGAGRHGDNERPRNRFEEHCQYVLISKHFYYFGDRALTIPAKFSKFEKKGPGFRADFVKDHIDEFIRWIEEEQGFEPGVHGKPCKKAPSRRQERRTCKSSC
jgi:hypothetical protein